MALIKCKECKKEVSNKADTCPHCGSPAKAKTSGCTVFFIIGIVAFIVCATMMDDTASSDPPPPPIPDKVEPAPTPVETKIPTIEEVEQEVENKEIPIPTVQEIVQDKSMWPNLLELKEPVSKPVILDGEEVGSQVFETGTKALILSVNNDETVNLDVRGTKVKVPVSHTNLVEAAHENLRLAQIAGLQKKAQLEAQAKRDAELAKQKAEQEKLEAERKAAIRANVEKQFSSWDGSHRGLERIVKDNTKDPKSYEHIESKWYTHDDHITVFLKYRAKNSFGGYVIGNASAKYAFTGDLIELLSIE